MTKLVRTSVVDKNGKPTTVYKRPAASNAKGLRALLSVFPRSNEPSKDDWIEAIIAESEELAPNNYSSFRKIAHEIKPENLQGTLEVLSHDKAGSEAVYAIDERYHRSSNKACFNDWLTEFTARYAEMKTWDSGQSDGPRDDTISKLVADMMHSRAKGINEAHLLGVMKVTCALIGTKLASSLHHRQTAYGMSYFMNDKYIDDFLSRHHDPESVDKACYLIASGNLNRLEDLDAVLSGEVPISIAEGML